MDNTGLSTTFSYSGYDYNKQIAKMSDEDKSRCLALTSKIDIHDISTIQAYGQEISAVVAQNGSTLLNSVKSNNSSEVVALTTDLLSQLEMIDIDELNANSGWKNFLRKIPIIGNMVTSVSNIMNKYDTIADNVEKISKKIDSSKIVAMRDNSTLQTIFDNNVQYIKQIRELIIGAKLKLQEITDKIAEMQANSNDYEFYQIQDMITFQNSLQKRIGDMETTEYVLTQNLFQIRATQENNVAIANKSDNIVNNIIPLWKNQLAISVIMNNQKASIEAQQKITDTTNKIMKANSENLKMNSINVAKANEEQILALDTLRDTTNDLIETIHEVKRIHEDGAREREKIESSLVEYTNKLADAIKNP